MTLDEATARRIGRKPTGDDRPAAHLISAAEMCRRADITYRQLDYWCVLYADVIDVEIAADGSGSQRWFRAGDAPKFHVVGELSWFGLRVGDAFRLTHQARRRILGRLRREYRTAGIATREPARTRYADRRPATRGR